MGTPGPKPRDPAPAEIVRACAEIRDGWDERTYLVRAGVYATREDAEVHPRWSPPYVSTRDLEMPLEALAW